MNTILTNIFKKKAVSFISVEFTPSELKIACLHYAGQTLNLCDYAFKKITSIEGYSREITGFINNFLKTSPLCDKKACLTISIPGVCFTKYLVLPIVPEKEMEDTIIWQLKKETQFNPQDYLFDWQVIGERVDEEGAKNNKIISVFAKRHLVEKYMNVVSSCGLSIERVSTPAFNYANILGSLADSAAITSILDIGAEESSLCIYRKGKLDFMRELAFSSQKIVKSLTGVLISDKGRVEITQDKAEEIKNAFGIPQDEAAILEDNISSGHIISLIRPLLETLAREIKRSFDYFSLEYKEESPSLVYLGGKESNLKNLAWYLNKELNLNVSKQLPLPNMVNTRQIEKERLNNDYSQLTSLIGACLGNNTAINLLPQDIKMRHIEAIQKMSLRTLAITAAAILLILVSIFHFQLVNYQKQLGIAQAHLDTLKEIKALKEDIDLKQGFVNVIQGNKIPVDGLLKALSVITPANILLNELDLDVPGHSLVLTGVVSSNENTAEATLVGFIKGIEASPFFKEASLVSSTNTGRVQEFEIRCALNN